MVTDNVLTHSFSEYGGVIQLVTKPKAREIEFNVSDCGVGIPKTLRDGLNTPWTDIQAIEESVKEGVTRGTGQGNGLFGSFQIATESKGAFSINSGCAAIYLSRSGKVKPTSFETDWRGTSVDCCISLQRPLILERALRFHGRAHIPQDLIDTEYEQDDGSICFSIRKEAKSIGSRQAGAETRHKIENLHKISGIIINIDFSGIGIMSSSFADELIGKLVDTYRHGFQNKFKISGISGANYMITDRSTRIRTGFDLESIISQH